MGFKKTILYIGGLLLATGGPITMFSTSDAMSGVKRSWFGGNGGTAVATKSASSPVAASSPIPETTPAIPPLAFGGPANVGPTPSLAEVLRFDVTVEWVMQRWPRVSTGLPYLQLQGYRVPLVTGTSMSDFAGSLTYYFNARQQVQRITFRGTSGDPSQMVALVTGRYQFVRRIANDPGVVFFEAVDSSNRSVGTLKIRSAAVVKASQPYSRYDVDLAMDRRD
jgi:hypothetical protein